MLALASAFGQVRIVGGALRGLARKFVPLPMMAATAEISAADSIGFEM